MACTMLDLLDACVYNYTKYKTKEMTVYRIYYVYIYIMIIFIWIHVSTRYESSSGHFNLLV
jgi:hypothetical protein